MHVKEDIVKSNNCTNITAPQAILALDDYWIPIRQDDGSFFL